MSSVQNAPSINLYAAGGSATNLARLLKQERSQFEDDQLSTFFIDTSKSNMEADIHDSQLFLFDGMDGSGKKRATNYTEVTERTPEILHKFKPADVNIVMHSSSGGSGSIIGPELVSQLLARQQLVIVVMVGSASSRIEINNTVKVMKSYEQIAIMRKLPVAVFYRENSAKASRGTVDNLVMIGMNMLLAFFSGQNKELDMSDLKNFINYQNVTSYPPRLTCLDFFSGAIDMVEGEHVLTMATLTDAEHSSEPPMLTEYQTVGFLSDSMKKSLNRGLPIHACVINGHFNQHIKRLTALEKEYEGLRSTILDKTIVSGDDSGATSSGIFL